MSLLSEFWHFLQKASDPQAQNCQVVTGRRDNAKILYSK